MSTPSGQAQPPAPSPNGQPLPNGSPPSGASPDAHVLEQLANELFREAFTTPAVGPAHVPAPTESSATVPPGGGEFSARTMSLPGPFAAPRTEAAPLRGAPTPLEAPASLARPSAPASAPFPDYATFPTFPGFSSAPTSPTPSSLPDGLWAAPTAGAAPGSVPKFATMPEASLFPSAGGAVGLLPGMPSAPSPAGAPGTTVPAAPAFEGSPPPGADIPWWLQSAETFAPGSPACRHTRDIETHLMADAMGSVPALAPPVEAEAERQSEGRGLASPLPSVERLFADAARFAAMPMGSAAPAAVAPSAAPAAPSAAGAPAPSLAGAPAVPRIPPATDAFDVDTVRRDFPALQQEVHGKPLVWLDNAATTQKPQAVIDAISRFYARDNSNIHRAAHEMARRATEAFENARDVVRRFLNASRTEEIVFVRGTTEAINLVAYAWGGQNLGPGDEILLTTLEHHANIVPWQFVARETGATIKVVPITDRGEVILEEYARLLGPRTRIVACTQVSNALGTVVPVREMAALAHRHGAPILVDGAQSVPHLRVDVQDLGADFFVFSGHKVFGPTGIGALYAKKALLDTMPPWQGGGSMIRTVTFERSTFADPPAKFEAGTPNIADAVGLAAAIEYIERLGIDRLERYEHSLLVYAEERMRSVPGLRPVGTAPHKASVLSFVFDGVRVEDVGRHLDADGIAVRAGHHCAMPSLARLGLSGTVRPSLAFYNTRGDVDRLVESLLRFRHS